MTQQEFLESYQIVYRKVNNGSQILIIDKRQGDLAGKYGFDQGQSSKEIFEIFTGKSLDELETEIYANQIASDFNIV